MINSTCRVEDHETIGQVQERAAAKSQGCLQDQSEEKPTSKEKNGHTHGAHLVHAVSKLLELVNAMASLQVGVVSRSNGSHRCWLPMRNPIRPIGIRLPHSLCMTASSTQSRSRGRRDSTHKYCRSSQCVGSGAACTSQQQQQSGWSYFKALGC